jgi:hypothetical protein
MMLKTFTSDKRGFAGRAGSPGGRAEALHSTIAGQNKYIAGVSVSLRSHGVRASGVVGSGIPAPDTHNGTLLKKIARKI